MVYGVLFYYTRTIIINHCYHDGNGHEMIFIMVFKSYFLVVALVICDGLFAFGIRPNDFMQL